MNNYIKKVSVHKDCVLIEYVRQDMSNSMMSFVETHRFDVINNQLVKTDVIGNMEPITSNNLDNFLY